MKSVIVILIYDFLYYNVCTIIESWLSERSRLLNIHHFFSLVFVLVLRWFQNTSCYSFLVIWCWFFSDFLDLFIVGLNCHSTSLDLFELISNWKTENLDTWRLLVLWVWIFQFFVFSSFLPCWQSLFSNLNRIQCSCEILWVTFRCIHWTEHSWSWLPTR